MSSQLWQYDEETELTRYLWDNYGELFSPQEQLLGQVLAARQAAEQHSSSNRRLAPRDYPGTYYDDPNWQRRLAPGSAALRQQAALRVMLSNREQITISRCPRCKRILKRLAAQQCYWCGLDWHDGRSSTSR